MLLFSTQTKVKDRVLNNLTNTREIEFDFLSDSIPSKQCWRPFPYVKGILGMSLGM